MLVRDKVWSCGAALAWSLSRAADSSFSLFIRSSVNRTPSPIVSSLSLSNSITRCSSSRLYASYSATIMRNCAVSESLRPTPPRSMSSCCTMSLSISRSTSQGARSLCRPSESLSESESPLFALTRNPTPLPCSPGEAPPLRGLGAWQMNGTQHVEGSEIGRAYPSWRMGISTCTLPQVHPNC